MRRTASSISGTAAVRRRPARKKRVLIVNTFLDEFRRTKGSPFRVPRAMGPAYLAGAFAPDLWDIRLYNEQYSGPLNDLDLLTGIDMLVMTGVTTSFDRMLHLTAYARALNEHAVVVAGGPPVRALKRRSKRFFDYVALGDIEEMQEIIRDVFGPEYASNEMFPRFDLWNQRGLFGYVESSRNCNFRCSFCSLTGEHARYSTYQIDYVRRQILAVGKRHIVFIDNNFYGNDRRYFLDRLALMKELVDDSTIRGWSCLVTGDFFKNSENLDLIREAGCRSIFSGVESFDATTLKSFNKRQNTLVPQVEMIRNCLESGVFFSYGLMFDPSSRSLREMQTEIEFVTAQPDITLPAFLTLAIPLLGTPYFMECMRDGLFFPNIRLRHLDGVTLSMMPIDPIDDVLEFVRDLPSLRGYRRHALHHLGKFLTHYAGRLSAFQLYAEMVTTALITAETLASSPNGPGRSGSMPTWYGPTEILDPQYTPAIHLPAGYERYFRPTLITDPDGNPAMDIAEDFDDWATRWCAAPSIHASA